MQMPFGKFKGRELADLPDDYVSWLLNIDLREPLASAIKREFSRRAAEAQDRRKAAALQPESEVLSLAARIIATGYKRLATTMHPDAGGEHAEMVLLNAVKDFLQNHLRGLAA